jgi:hypothetical protein
MGGVAGSGDCREDLDDACGEGGNKDSRCHAQDLRDHGGDDHPAGLRPAIALSNAACFERHRIHQVPLSGWPLQGIVKKWLTACWVFAGSHVRAKAGPRGNKTRPDASAIDCLESKD